MGNTPPPAAPQPSKGWLLDILSDERGVSVHRVQQVAFTLVAGYFFVRSVWKKLELPEWDSQQLLLLLISSATYLGLKTKEQPVATTGPGAGGAGGASGAGNNAGTGS